LYTQALYNFKTESVCDPKCKNGNCENGTCICKDYWIGKSCEGCTEINKCGMCGVPDINCPCPEGFSGTKCNVRDLCYKVNCGEFGTCSNGTCLCDQNHVGKSCQYSSCSFNGMWSAQMNKCVCSRGWAGESCAVCDLKFKPGKTSVCVPLKDKEYEYAFLSVRTELANQWRQGIYGGKLKSYFEGNAIFPGSFISNKKGSLDCHCDFIESSPSGRKNKKEVIQTKTELSEEEIIDICTEFIQDNSDDVDQLILLLEGLAEVCEEHCDQLVARGWMISTVVFIVVVSIFGGFIAFLSWVIIKVTNQNKNFKVR